MADRLTDKQVRELRTHFCNEDGTAAYPYYVQLCDDLLAAREVLRRHQWAWERCPSCYMPDTPGDGSPQRHETDCAWADAMGKEE